jgi:hypothetical protein
LEAGVRKNKFLHLHCNKILIYPQYKF